MSKRSFLKRTFISFVLVVMSAFATFAQGNSFNFQGRLNDGTNPANGRYDLQFQLYDAIAGGNQIGVVLSRPNTTLINGVFSVSLDFGATAFNSPNSVFIEIAIRPNASPNAYTILGPRQQLTVVPFAVHATNADNAVLATNAQHSIDGQIAVNATNAVTAINALSLGGFSATEYPRLNVVNTGDLKTNGALAITGNAFQPITSNGFAKAMVVVNSNGTIRRCFNGITGSSTGNCGITVTRTSRPGDYLIDFGFQVSDRFAVVTPLHTSPVNIVASISDVQVSPNIIDVITDITDVDYSDSFADNPFILILY